MKMPADPAQTTVDDRTGIQEMVARITPQETYDLRHRILRPHQRIEDCQYPLDFERNSFHLGAFDKRKLIGIASFFQEAQQDLDQSQQYRLRGMATAEHVRGMGFGLALMKSGIQILEDRQADVLWCNARTHICGFYEKLGMTAMGKPFDLPPIGMHRVMVRLF